MPEVIFFNSAMKTSDFNFELPEKLIAQYPVQERGQSRLLVMDRTKRQLEHRMLSSLPSILEKGTLIVFNNSRVRRSRIYGISVTTGARVEFLLLDKVCENGAEAAPLSETGKLWRAMVQRAGRRRTGSRYLFGGAAGEKAQVSGSLYAEITGGDRECRFLKFYRPVDDAWLDIHGHVPLPPYIRRNDSSDDAERYQTVFAGDYGSAAAPTAGLHFTEALLNELRRAGMETVFITLHVGLGTFLPVRTEDVEAHRMHEENFIIDETTACRIENAKAEGRKILAVGTTSVRTLESAWKEDSTPGKSSFRIKRGEGTTSIFIYPGYNFKAVDALFTNFHTPASTLLMLVCAFAGRDFVLETYKEAIKDGYRFYSYGDACLIL
jgi:S-adenosylmethionine:tRNA ribosyltransferase-isomerase